MDRWTPPVHPVDFIDAFHSVHHVDFINAFHSVHNEGRVGRRFYKLAVCSKRVLKQQEGECHETTALNKTDQPPEVSTPPL